MSTSLRLMMLGVALFVTPGVHAQQQVAYVVDLEGNWSLNGGRSRLITRGQSLPGGTSISPLSPSTYDFIVVANLKGEIIARRNCRNTGECNNPIKLPPPPKQPGIISTAFGVVMNLIWGEPDRYSVHRTRSGELLDGVVRLTGDRLDLTPIFSKTDKGRYYLRLLSVSAPSKEAKQAKKTSAAKVQVPSGQSITLDWDPERPSPVSVPDMKAGLYELTLLERGNDGFTPSDLSSWILVSRENTYEKSAESYRQAVDVTVGWGNAVTPEASRGFLRAHLDQLSKGAVR